MMADLNHNFGNDLVFSATGDLLIAADLVETDQRILRRLLTPSGAYIWELTYGAGLPQQIGSVADVLAIQNAVRGQIFQEPTVAKVPEPIIIVNATNGGLVNVAITYTEAVSGQTRNLSIPVT